jgi:hypothetical protein
MAAYQTLMTMPSSLRLVASSTSHARLALKTSKTPRSSRKSFQPSPDVTSHQVRRASDSLKLLSLCSVPALAVESRSTNIPAMVTNSSMPLGARVLCTSSSLAQESNSLRGRVSEVPLSIVVYPSRKFLSVHVAVSCRNVSISSSSEPTRTSRKARS